MSGLKNRVGVCNCVVRDSLTNSERTWKINPIATRDAKKNILGVTGISENSEGNKKGIKSFVYRYSEKFKNMGTEFNKQISEAWRLPSRYKSEMEFLVIRHTQNLRSPHQG